MSEKKSHLTLYICIAIVAAVGLALVAPKFAMNFEIGGEIFLRILKMMVVPLVVTSVMSGILGLGDVRKLGKPGGYAVFYYFSTTVLAVIIGLAVVNIIRPGVGTVDQAVLDKALDIEPPLATSPVPSHTRPMPSKFVVDEDGGVTLTDWEWATLGPPEWDLTLAVWQFASINGEDAAAAFRKGYAAELPESRYRSWVAYHAAMMMLDAAEVREGRLGDLSYLVDDLAQAVLGT